MTSDRMQRDADAAANVLAALERAIKAADPLPAFLDAYEGVLRNRDRERICDEARHGIATALAWAEVAVAKALPPDFDRERLRVGVDTLALLLIAWAEPERALAARPDELETHLLNARIFRNDIDSLCARSELLRAGATGFLESPIGAARGAIH